MLSWTDMIITIFISTLSSAATFYLFHKYTKPEVKEVKHIGPRKKSWNNRINKQLSETDFEMMTKYTNDTNQRAMNEERAILLGFDKRKGIRVC